MINLEKENTKENLFVKEYKLNIITKILWLTVTELSSNSFIIKKLIWFKGFVDNGFYSGAFIWTCWSCCLLFFFLGRASLPLMFDNVNIIDYGCLGSFERSSL